MISSDSSALLHDICAEVYTQFPNTTFLGYIMDNTATNRYAPKAL